MKIAVISKRSPDYLIDVVTDGLVRLVGRDHLSIDYNVRFEPGGKGSYQHLCLGLKGPEPFGLHDADCLVASVRSVEAAKQWKTKTGRKVAIIDGEDLKNLDYRGLAVANVYFKREYFHFTPYPSHVKPLPFAAIPETVLPSAERKCPVFYSGHLTHPFRKEISDALRAMGFPPAPNQDKSEYNKSLSTSRIGVSIRGMGWDTYRYWEIPYFGAALLAHRPGHVIPENLIAGAEAFFYDTAADFRAKLRRMLDDHPGTEKIALAGQKAIQERHLSIHRARTVLESLA